MSKRDFTSAKAKEALLKDKEKLCGECCWFYAEDIYGYGCCPFRFAEVKDCEQPCEIPLKYVSKKQMRHHQAVLLQFNRYRRDDDGIYVCPNPTEIGNAIDFACWYMKVFSEL